MLGVVRSADIDTGGHNVDEVAGLGAEFVFGGDAGRPVGDERGGDAAFVVVVFEEAEGSVLGEGPAFAAEPVGVRLSGVAFRSA